jgi:hypothetical protein
VGFHLLQGPNVVFDEDQDFNEDDEDYGQACDLKMDKVSRWAQCGENFSSGEEEEFDDVFYDD